MQKKTLIHSEKRPKKLHKKIQKNVIQKNVPKNLQNPEKNTKKIENTSRLKKNCQKNRKNNETEKIPHPQKKNQQKTPSKYQQFVDEKNEKKISFKKGKNEIFPFLSITFCFNFFEMNFIKKKMKKSP